MWIHAISRTLLIVALTELSSLISITWEEQVLANRPDIIREDYMNELCILQDDVPPFPNEVKKLIFLQN